jgi:hypothetical protein
MSIDTLDQTGVLPMTTYDWLPFLKQWSVELLDSPDTEHLNKPEGADIAQWMGYSAASETEIAAVEVRLGKLLPPSYRSFLAVTNGWSDTGAFIYQLWPADKIEWFKVRNQQWIDAYNDPRNVPSVSEAEHRAHIDEDQDSIIFRAEYMQTALEISDVGDSAILLLNPLVVTPDGEWEAWFFANWLPGATRYSSFWKLMHGLHDTFSQLGAQERKRYRPDKAATPLLAKLDNLIGELNQKALVWENMAKQTPDIPPTNIMRSHNSGIALALRETAQTVNQFRGQESDSTTIKSRLLALAESLDAENRNQPTGQAEFARMTQYMFDPPRLKEILQRKGMLEGKREAAGIIRWFFA